MTKAEFNEKYPNGASVIVIAFKKSLHEVMTSVEIDRLINSTKGSERRWLRNFKKAYAEAVSDWDFPFEPFLMGIKSPTLLKDVIALMIDKFGVYRGENEPEE